MAKVYLMTGTNRGEVEKLMQEAARMIGEQVGEILRMSKVWYTEPWGFKQGGIFLNQALEVRTELTPEQVLDEVQKIELELGRNRTEEAEIKRENGERYASRTMDIDIILYEDMVVESDRLKIPHPLMQEREFVLGPMCELVADMVHPVYGVTLAGLKEKLAEKTEEAAGER